MEFPTQAREREDDGGAQVACQAFDKSRRLAEPAPPKKHPKNTGSWPQRARQLLTRRKLSSGVREKGKGRWARQAPSTYGHLNQTPSLARGAWPTQLIRTGSHTLNNSCCHPSWRRITIPLQSRKVCADRDSRTAELSRRAGGETKHNKTRAGEVWMRLIPQSVRNDANTSDGLTLMPGTEQGLRLPSSVPPSTRDATLHP